MAVYLIEFRFQGYAKRYLKKIIFEVGRKFRVKGVTGKHVVPHITLFGPFSTRDEKKLVETFHRVLRKHNLYYFNLKGFSNFDKRVIFVDIKPSEELNELRQELAKELINLRSFLFFKTVKTKPFDYEEDFSFHATIAFKDIGNKFDRILNYLKHKAKPTIHQRLLRVTLLRNRKILHEYDFLQKRLLNGQEALNRQVWKRTIELLKQNNPR